jgi:hypothetical protein
MVRQSIYKDPDLWVAIAIFVFLTVAWIFIRVDWLQTLAVGFAGLLMGALKAGLTNGNGEKP